MTITLPETNSKFAPENGPKRPKRKRSYSNYPFSGAMLFLFMIILWVGKIAIRHNERKLSSSSSLSLVPSPYQMKCTSIHFLKKLFHKTYRKNTSKPTANLFFLRAFDNPNKGILDLNGWYIRILSTKMLSSFLTDPSFGASDMQI